MFDQNRMQMNQPATVKKIEKLVGERIVGNVPEQIVITFQFGKGKEAY